MAYTLSLGVSIKNLETLANLANLLETRGEIAPYKDYGSPIDHGKALIEAMDHYHYGLNRFLSDLKRGALQSNISRDPELVERWGAIATLIGNLLESDEFDWVDKR